jgi:indole-3-glycerol phosphate synthase
MNILDTIVARKRLEVARLHARAPNVKAAELESALRQRGPRRDFLAALRRASHAPALIAEVKKASPSAGLICPNFDAAAIAKQYEAAGASCISVLTDETFFQGSLEDLSQVRAAVRVPLLRKDFIVDSIQVVEAIEWGADAVLLIARILDDAHLTHLLKIAAASGLAALVEVHDQAELERALAAGAELIGVNNRNLDNFTVDLAVTERLAPMVPAGSASRLLVAESGIHTRADVERLRRAGAKAILVGEALMKNPDGIAAKISELLAR